MSQSPKESLHQIFRDLHAHRVATMDPAVLQVNINQRKTLVDSADRSRFVKVGDTVEPFSLPEVDGGRVTLDGLLEHGPAVLIFFRFEGCPACNLALPYYQRNLLPGLQAFRARLVALSPQVPEKLVQIKRRHSLDFDVASDVDNGLGRKFGILYSADEASRKLALANNRPIGDVTGTGTWELPMPTAVVIDRNRVVRFADVHPDWLVRTEADPILSAVATLSAPSKDRSSTASASA
jgi:peroxiredoxin